ncbi:Tc toxin subunit A [Achromobacter aloeverae]|nr:Tc toxin subunit A [Achromobacter aloeverae]
MTGAIRAVERHCGLDEGTLEALGLASVQAIVSHDEAGFLRDYAARVGSAEKAKCVYRLALSAQERLLRLYKAANYNLAGLLTEAGNNYPYTDQPVGNRPNWAMQFPMLNPFAEPGDISNSNSPAAYLANLYWVATRTETMSSDNLQDRVLLAQRRPDLADLAIDDRSVNQIVSKLSLVSEALQAYLSTTKGELLEGYTNGASTALDNDALLTRVYYPGPTLPYHKPYDQIVTALAARKVTLGDIVLAADPAMPASIISTSAPRTSTVNALLASNGLSPDRGLLVSQQVDVSGWDWFAQQNWYQTNYGLDAPTDGADPQQDLRNVATLADQTGQAPGDVRRMLCVNGNGVKGSTVTLTPNVDADVTGLVADPAHYGATFISGAQQVFLVTTPSTLTLADSKTVSVGDALGTSSGGVPDDGHFFRFNRMFRLRKWTGLPAEELDTFLKAAMAADSTHAGVIDRNTLRMLGFHGMWSRAYGLSGEDAAAILASVSPYAVEDGVSHFDRIFNAAPGQAPICIGSAKSTFNYADGSDGGIVGKLCAALKITEADFQLVAASVSAKQKLAGGVLNRTLPVLSALFRWTRVASCLRVSVGDLFLLLARLPDGSLLKDALSSDVGSISDIGADGKIVTTHRDVLDALLALAELVSFIRLQGLTPAGFGNLVPASLTDGFPVPAATAAHLAVLKNVAQLLPNALFELSAIETLGLPPQDDSATPVAIDWVQIVKDSKVVQLDDLADTAGLIGVETPAARQAAIAKALRDSTLTLDSTAEGDLKYQSLLDNFTAAQHRQYGVSDGVLSEALGLDMATAHNMLLAFGGNASYGFLHACQGILEMAPEPTAADLGPLMPILNQYAHHALLVKHYALTPAGLAGLANAPWFGLAATKSGAPTWWMHSLPCLYALNGYLLWCQRVGNEDDVLQYLQDYNVDTPETDKASAELARQLNLDASTMQAYADWVTQAAKGVKGTLQDTTQMGRVLALMGLGDQTGLKLSQILSLAALNFVQAPADPAKAVDSDFVTWQTAAAGLMATLDYVPPNAGDAA